MTLGQSIYYYRKRSGLSQEELAERTGVSRQAVSRWELDETTPEVGKLKALAQEFSITVDQLLSGEIPEESGESAASEETAPEQPHEDKSSGVVGRMIRRHGWLAGVYIALQGLGITLVGALARFAFGRMFQIGAGLMGTGVDGYGHHWEPHHSFGGFGQETAISGMGGVFQTIATVIMGVGAVVMVAGTVLAVVLYLKGRKD